jgi:hypothetical protein
MGSFFLLLIFYKIYYIIDIESELINMKNKNVLRFELIDNTRLNSYNESCTMEKTWFGETNDGQVLDIETYYTYCKQFASAMGFGEKTIEEWFGDF